MRLVIVISQKLHRMRRHHGQPEPSGQLNSCRHMALIIGALGALQLQVKTVREDARQMQSALQRPRAVTLHQRLADSTALRARQSDQPFIELFKPFQLDDGLVAHHALRPGA